MAEIGPKVGPHQVKITHDPACNRSFQTHEAPGTLCGLVAQSFPNSALFYLCHRAVLRAAKGHVLVLGLFLGSVLFSGSAWWLAILVVSIYFLTALSPTIFSSVILHGNKMHPKYAFAKRRFALHYPWDLVDV